MEIAKINEAADLDSAWCEVDDPRTGDYAFSLLIAGPKHSNTRAFAESEGRSLAHQGKRLGNIQKAMDARAEMILTDSETAVARQVASLMARTLDWKDITNDGAQVPFDAGQMRAWYEQHTWLRDAVFVFMGEPCNFLAKPSTT